MARRNHICFTKCLNSTVTIYPKTLGKTIAQECKKTTLLAHVHRSKNDAIIQCISKSPEQTTKSRKIASPRITAHVFWSFPNGMTQIIWFSKKNFRISRVNGTYLVSNALYFTCTFVHRCRIVYDHHIVLVHVLFAIRAGVGLFCFLSRESNTEQATPLTGCLPCFAGFSFGVSGLFAVKAVQLYRGNATVVSTDQRFQTIRLKTTEHSIHRYNAFKCKLKELTTKSALSAWGHRSLACARPVGGYIDHVIYRRVQFPFVLGSVSHFLPFPPSP